MLEQQAIQPAIFTVPDNGITTTAEPRVTVVIPTYNERENLPVIVARLTSLEVPNLRMLVVDDDSPDGTGDVADALAEASRGRVTVLHRACKEGLGRAYVAGMNHALAHGAEVVIQMDADLSHPVDAVPRMLDALSRTGAGMVVGSRYVVGGSTSDVWPWRRRALSRLANGYVDAVLGLQVKDATSGFKAWPASSLLSIDVSSVESVGYAFQIEMTQAARRLGMDVVEVPFHFEDRTQGASKMTLRILFESAFAPWRLRHRQRVVR